MSRTKPQPAVVVCPFTIAIDTREQAPWSFQAIKADAADGGAPTIVRTVSRTLQSGDYSIDGYSDLIAVERKSLDDLYGTLSQGRERFERELDRLNFMHFATVVIEAGWGRIMGDPPMHSKLAPKSVFRSIIAWQQRFPRVHWNAFPDRRFAELATYQILRRFWLDRLDQANAAGQVGQAEVAHAASRS